MTIEKQKEVLNFLRDNKVEPTEVNKGLMALLNIEYVDNKCDKSSTWFIVVDDY